MNDASFPDILQADYNLSEYESYFMLGQLFPDFEKRSEVESIAVVLDHVHVIFGLDPVMQPHTEFRLHHRVEPDFFFYVGHFFVINFG